MEVCCETTHHRIPEDQTRHSDRGNRRLGWYSLECWPVWVRKQDEIEKSVSRGLARARARIKDPISGPLRGLGGGVASYHLGPGDGSVVEVFPHLRVDKEYGTLVLGEFRDGHILVCLVLEHETLWNLLSDLDPA